jgi:hypothetical protein
MKTPTSDKRPEDSGFTVVKVRDELNFDDVFLKLHKMLLSEKQKVWWEVEQVNRTDFTATSVYLLNNLVKDYRDSWPAEMVVVADTDLSHFVVETSLALLRLDGFQGPVQLFSSREAALRWLNLANLLH